MFYKNLLLEKRLNLNLKQKKELDAAAKEVMANPTLGEHKKGGLPFAWV